MHFAPLASYANDSVECLDDNAASEFVSGAIAGSKATKVEQHLASCRDCRALVAALAGTGDVDTQAETHQHERVTESQAGKLPRKYTIGDRVGRYLVLSTLGAGGMGVVFAAYDPQLDRKVALKLLRANLGANAKEARKRLKREAQAIAQLNHPNVVGVYDVGTTDEGDVYIAMEFVEGDTVSTWLKRWPRTWREILEIFHQAARGLMAAHSVGLLHRDFKPDNVLVGGDGRVRVTDFGLARSVLVPDEIVTAGSRNRPKPDTAALHVELTATGTVLGTPRYMPPEQLTGPDIDSRSDQFSFCVALYEALFGTHPLPGATSVSMLEHGDEALAPPEGTRVPPTIARAVMRGLQRERTKRFPGMSALVHELVPPVQRSPVRFAATIAIGLVVIGGATAAVMTRPEAPLRIPTNDTPEMALLVNRINQLEKERKDLIELLKKQEASLKDLEHAQKEIEKKDEQIHELMDQVKKYKLEQIKSTPAVAVKAPPPLVSGEVSKVLQAINHDLEGCFDEWSQRQALEAIEAVKRPVPKEAELEVKLGITPDGSTHDSHATGELDVQHDGSMRPSHGILSECVEGAVARAPYPKGPEALDVVVQVVWMSGVVNATATVVGRHEASSRPVDF
jgi:serine/threonine protein kinase